MNIACKYQKLIEVIGQSTSIESKVTKDKPKAKATIFCADHTLAACRDATVFTEHPARVGISSIAR